MNSFLLVLVKYLAFLSGRNAEQLGGDMVSEDSGDSNVYGITTTKFMYSTAEYYDYELDTAPTIAPKTVTTTTTEEVPLAYEYEETTISYKDYVTDVYGELVTRRLSRKKKRKKVCPYIRIEDLGGKDFDNITKTTEPVTISTYDEIWSLIPPVRNRTRCPKSTDVIQVPEPTFHLSQPAGFIIFQYDSKLVWPVMILWSINKQDVSKEISSVRGFFVRDHQIDRWIHDNCDQTFSKHDIFRYMIKYAYKRNLKVTEHFRRYYTVNISEHWGRYLDLPDVYDKAKREDKWIDDMLNEHRIDLILDRLWTPIPKNFIPKVVHLYKLKNLISKTRGRKARRWALIQKINKAKARLGITESTFLIENVTTKRFRSYFAVGGHQYGFGYLRSHNKQPAQRLFRRRYRRHHEDPINEKLAKRLGINVATVTASIQQKKRRKRLLKRLRKQKN